MLPTSSAFSSKPIGWLAPVLIGSLLLSPSATGATVSFQEQGAADQQESLPDGAELCDRAERAVASARQRAEIKNVVYRGSTKIKGMAGFKGKLTEIVAKPLLARTKTEFPGMGAMEDGCDGETVWEINGPQGVTVHAGEPRFLRCQGYRSQLLMPWRELYAEAETLGIETVRERPCYKIRLKPKSKDGREEFFYLDQETHLAAKVELMMKEPHSQQVLPIRIWYGDYREVNGIKHSFERTIKVSMMEVVQTYESIEHNAELESDVFELPESVQAKVKEMQAKEKEGTR